MLKTKVAEYKAAKIAAEAAEDASAWEAVALLQEQIADLLVEEMA